MSDDTTLPQMDDQTREFFELMQRDEPLHPDLLPYVEEDGPFGPMLRHPLVYEMHLTGPAMINKRYAQKLEARDRAVAARDWDQYIWIHERPHRLDALLGIESTLKYGDFWKIARNVWVDSENVWQHFDEWLLILNEPRPARAQFMLPEERKALRTLPETVTIFRGCHQDLNDDGLSWTLDYTRAKWFAQRFERDGHPGVVLTGTILRSKIHAYLPQARGEEEVIPRHPEFVRVSAIEEVEPRD